MTTETPSVMLVDDDIHSREIFRMLMEHCHVSHAITETATEGIEYLKDHSPDIVIIDLVLPDISGFDALDIARRITDPGRCLILATTAFYTMETGHAVLAHGFDGYVPKPFVRESFLPYVECMGA
ncbi:MAG: response regulator [Anaerolineae bacterium]